MSSLRREGKARARLTRIRLTTTLGSAGKGREGEAVPEVQKDQVTELLQQWVSGNEKALGILVPLVYQELRRLAHLHLQSERVDHTLQSTALVNEAFLRLNGADPIRLQNRGHFIAIASRAMRQILVEYARSRGARKRDGGCRIAIEDLGELPSGD